MYCMKCGREVEEQQVFCEECRLEMEKYPVRPGTVVLLPRRTENNFAKKVLPKRRMAPTPEEQIKRLKKWLRLTISLLLVAIAVLVALVYPSVKIILEEQRFGLGQNYTSITTDNNTP